MRFEWQRASFRDPEEDLNTEVTGVTEDNLGLQVFEMLFLFSLCFSRAPPVRRLTL
jgi:hypothetical protein